ncbi:PREDICTED: general odorant-binding protein 28a [Drosophila arizonae]|uniref:General odorant-binding protein 28a n=1 Tax=Drosophila arizonae TaxID=7263 RepID=A0ABM1NUA7_DROAR|nr:PREDICTED: general odorant-binding protein 28a [Drosophila arizonae]
MQRFVYSVACVALLGAALIAAFDEKEALAKFIEKAEQCKDEVGASDAEVQTIVKHEAASTYEGKCLRACIMKSFHVLGENGKLDVEAGREKAKQYTGSDPAKLEMALEIGDICAAIPVPDDHCEAAEKYSLCFKEEAHKRGLI